MDEGIFLQLLGENLIRQVRLKIPNTVFVGCSQSLLPSSYLTEPIQTTR